jgi:hypothetical protein
LQGIAQERIEDQDRRVPNEGIQRSLRNSLLIGLISAGIIGVISMLSLVSANVLGNGLTYMLSDQLSKALSFALSHSLSHAPSVGLRIGLLGGLLVCISMGGLAVWRHYLIRFLLWRSHTFPGRAPQFLNDSSARFLLRRIGGGYSFIHRLLLDYFAKHGGEASPHSQENERPEP